MSGKTEGRGETCGKSRGARRIGLRRPHCHHRCCPRPRLHCQLPHRCRARDFGRASQDPGEPLGALLRGVRGVSSDLIFREDDRRRMSRNPSPIQGLGLRRGLDELSRREVGIHQEQSDIRKAIFDKSHSPSIWALSSASSLTLSSRFLMRSSRVSK